MKAMRRVSPGSLAAALLGLSCALATSALIARQQALTDEGPSTIGTAEFAAEIRPAGETVLTAPAAVLITKTLTSIGDRVTEGQALIEVDDTQIRADVAAAELSRSAAAQRVASLRDSSASLDQSIALVASSLSDANRRLSAAQRQMELVPRLINGIAKEQAARVLVANDSTALDGRVRSVAPLPDSAGTHRVEIEFRNPKGS